MILINSKTNDSGIHTKVDNFNDFLQMTLDVLDYFLTNHSRVMEVDVMENSAFMVVIMDKRATVFFNDCKYVSIHFPFGYSIRHNNFHYRSEVIDVVRVSHLRTILQKTIEKGDLIEGLAKCNDGILPTEMGYVTDADKKLYTALCTLEPGYLRFDNDEKNANGRYHPLTHLDINYTSGSTYKIGLYGQPSKESFLRLLDNDKERSFIESDSILTRLQHLWRM